MENEIKTIKKIKNVSVGPAEIQKKIDAEIVKANEDKAQAVEYTEEEARIISTGKLRERLNRQKRYRELYLSRIYTGVKLQTIRSEIDSGLITMQNGYNEKMSMAMAMCEHDIVENTYFNLRSEEINIREALLKDGLSEEQISQIEKQNTYFKEESDFNVIKPKED